MSDREPTRWQHNRIYPQPMSLCECMIVIHDCVNFLWVVIKNARIVSYALLNNCGQGSTTYCSLFVQCHLEKYLDENNHDHLLTKSFMSVEGVEVICDYAAI